MTDSARALATDLDKVVATLVVSHDSDERRFIGGELLLGAAAYLLARYVDKYLEGLGVDEWAKQHGRKTRKLLQKLRRGDCAAVDARKLVECYEEAASRAREEPPSADAREQAFAGVMRELVELGAVRRQAEIEATKVAKRADLDMSV